MCSTPHDSLEAILSLTLVHQSLVLVVESALVSLVFLIDL
jgi:hypothetical protein